jgi:hypothetical protein
VASFYIKLPKNLTEITNSTLTVNGPITVTNEVEVNNDVGNPIPVSGTVAVTGVSTLLEQQAQTTVLGSIDTELQTVNVNLASIDLHVDQVESLLTSIDNRLVPPTLKNYYNEVLSVSSGVYNTILSKTVTLSSKLKLIQSSGANIAEYEVVLNGNVIDKQRTNFGTQLNCTFSYENGIALTSGDTLLIRARHDRPYNADFNAKFILEE